MSIDANRAHPSAGAVQSMTGYATVSQTTRAGNLSLELRSVNSRFLDIQVRMPDDLRPFEPTIRESLMARLQRGKVECRVSWSKDTQGASLPRLRHDLITQLATLQQSVQTAVPSAAGFSVSDILHWPGVIEDDALTADELRDAFSQVIEQAGVALIEARQREGARLAAVLLEKIAAMQAVLDQLKPRLPEFLQAQADKITARLQESFAKAAQSASAQMATEEINDRIRQEVGLHQVRVDISEEIDRLGAHFAEIARILKGKGPVGKRLDFLTQELNREANTLGSKSTAIEQTQASIELKVLIEQVREQVQNLE